MATPWGGKRILKKNHIDLLRHEVFGILVAGSVLEHRQRKGLFTFY